MPIVPLTPGSLRGTWKHDDTKFILILAGLCGWTGRTEKGKSQVHLHAKDGTDMTVPDNTGLNASVFGSWVRRVWTHRQTDAKPRVIWSAMEDCKLDRSHRRAAWESLDMRPYMPPGMSPIKELVVPDSVEAVQEEAAQTSADPYRIMNQGRTVLTADHLESAIDIAASSLTQTSGPWSVVEIATGTTKALLRYEGEGVVKIMPHVSSNGVTSKAVFVRTWSDGHVDYACTFPGCDYTNSTTASVGSHHRAHTADRSHWKSRVVRAEQQAQIAAIPEDFNPMAVHTGLRTPDLGHHDHLKHKPVETPPATSDDATRLRRILGIVAPEILRENENLKAELAVAKARADEAEAKLSQLRNLINP